MCEFVFVFTVHVHVYVRVSALPESVLLSTTRTCDKVSWSVARTPVRRRAVAGLTLPVDRWLARAEAGRAGSGLGSGKPSKVAPW